MNSFCKISIMSSIIALAACSTIKKNKYNTPDEFTILPYKKLEMPANYKNLPEPTLGTTNRVDQDPIGETLVALGGGGTSTPTDTEDQQKLLKQATRLGVDEDIRETIYTEDASNRSAAKGRVLERVVGKTAKQRTYQDSALDSEAETQRLQSQDVQVSNQNFDNNTKQQK